MTLLFWFISRTVFQVIGPFSILIMKNPYHFYLPNTTGLISLVLLWTTFKRVSAAFEEIVNDENRQNLYRER